MSHASVLVALEGSGFKLPSIRIIEEAVAYQMQPFDENGECFKDGSRWDWFQIGGRYTGRLCPKDILLKKDLDLDRLHKRAIETATKVYQECIADKEKNDQVKAWWYGVQPGETLEQLIERTAGKKELSVAHYAFLRARHWHEGGRLGWLGGQTATECERHAPEGADVETMIRRCKHKDPKTGASIVTWNEPSEIWQQEFYRRFVDPLPPYTVLVTVDYHV